MSSIIDSIFNDKEYPKHYLKVSSEEISSPPDGFYRENEYFIFEINTLEGHQALSADQDIIEIMFTTLNEIDEDCFGAEELLAERKIKLYEFAIYYGDSALLHNLSSIEKIYSSEEIKEMKKILEAVEKL